MTITAIDDVISRAAKLAHDEVRLAAARDEVLSAAGGDRTVIEAARDEAATRIRARVDDFEATAALRLLNQVLAEVAIDDPLDWKVRWGQRFRRP